jgi:Lrp/AsnC family transcriptional regulator, leucine-responsive regulatory protein
VAVDGELQILHDAQGLSAQEAQILHLLADHARMTNAAVADTVGIPASTSLLRLQNLQQRQVVRGFHTNIDRKALGLHLAALVAVELEEQGPTINQRFFEECRRLEHVVAVLQVSGKDDFLLLAYVTSTDQLLERVIHPVGTIPHVRRTDTSIVFEHWQRHSCLGDMTRS